MIDGIDVGAIVLVVIIVLFVVHVALQYRAVRRLRAPGDVGAHRNGQRDRIGRG